MFITVSFVCPVTGAPASEMPIVMRSGAVQQWTVQAAERRDPVLCQWCGSSHVISSPDYFLLSHCHTVRRQTNDIIMKATSLPLLASVYFLLDPISADPSPGISNYKSHIISKTQ